MSALATVNPPYLLFLGNAPDSLAAKTAQGVAQWRPQDCVGQWRLDACKADLGLPDMDAAQAYAAGARTLIVGVANRGGVIAPEWEPLLLDALERGYDLASGLHQRLGAIPSLAAAAKANGRTITDVRHPPADLPVGTGAKRHGKRLLTVGTDCSVGKMYTSLALAAEMQRRGMKADFRATGQTGIFIVGTGISVDAVVADFISGATELLAPENDPDHWDIVEGQGSLFHASFAGVSLGLLHGSQPDALVICHEPNRPHMRGLPHYPLPTLTQTAQMNLQMARLTNPAVAVVGVALNTKALDQAAAEAALAAAAEELGVPAVDPVRTGVAAIVDRLQG